VSTDLLFDLVSQAEASRLRGVSRQAIAKLVKEGKLRGFKVAGRVLVSRAEVENYQIKPAGRPRNGLRQS
jgi:excisionase family DNA binding protein